LFYLAGAMTMFTDSGMMNYQIQDPRRRDALPMTRNYVFDVETQLRAIVT
jgi:cyclopropane-fatty-acyl-phospholipid synthase